MGILFLLHSQAAVPPKATAPQVISAVQTSLEVPPVPTFPSVDDIHQHCVADPDCNKILIEQAYELDLQATANRMQPQGTYANSYSGGNCTWYVASRVSVPSFMGNAKYWASGLANSGWRSGNARVGAIGVTQAGWAGHVVVVESATDQGVLISEMNYNGLGYVDSRWVSSSEFTWFF